MEFHEQLITSADGRTIETSTYGDPAGHAVFVHHGTPGSTRLLPALASLADDGSLFLIGTSRPGYGSSTRLEHRDAAGVVDDVRAVLDYYRVDDYAALGWSGGGPHALACAALDPPRCLGAVLLASVAPADVDFDWTEGMGPENVEEFALAKAGGPAYQARLELIGEFLAKADASNVVELFGGLLSDADKASLADEDARKVLAEAIAHGFANGWQGYGDDDHVVMSPWGFHVNRIDVPVEVFYGDQDLMVPPSHATWLLKNLRHGTAHHYPNEGHVSIFVRQAPAIAAALSSLFHG